MPRLFQNLKPSDLEIRDLALRETDPTQAGRFEPICRGPIFALVALVLVGLIALPSLLLRIWRGRHEDRRIAKAA